MSSTKIIILIIFSSIFLYPKKIKCELNDCPKNFPIRTSLDSSCQNITCTKTQFESKQCIISNSIIKNQWLNNIIIINESVELSYITATNTPYGDIIILALPPNSLTNNYNNYFYGIDKNGRGYFSDFNKT